MEYVISKFLRGLYKIPPFYNFVLYYETNWGKVEGSNQNQMKKKFDQLPNKTIFAITSKLKNFVSSK